MQGPPTGDPGYTAGLLRRMASEEQLPQSGPFPSSVDWVSWRAFREAERLADPAVVPHVEAIFRAGPGPEVLDRLGFILAGLLSNARSPGAVALFLEVAEATPDEPMAVHYVISHARRGRIAEARDYVLRHLPTRHRSVLSAILQYLGEMGGPGDIPALGALLDSDTEGLGCGIYCAHALGTLGRPEALPYLERAVERHRKARKDIHKDTRNAAEAAIARIRGEPT